MKTDIPDEMTIQGDQAMLQILMDELLDNAWKFMGSQSRPCVELGEKTHDDQPFYFVRDNGIGLDMAYVNKLFRNFEQLHQPGLYEGTGMGLAIVQRIVQRHGGKVWVEGEPGKGMTVYFSVGKIEA